MVKPLLIVYHQNGLASGIHGITPQGTVGVHRVAPGDDQTHGQVHVLVMDKTDDELLYDIFRAAVLLKQRGVNAEEKLTEMVNDFIDNYN